MNITIESVVVRNINGSLDLEASLGKFAEVLATWEAQEAGVNSAIATHLSALFDTFRGERLNAKFIYSQVLPALGATPATWGDMEKKVLAFIKASPDYHTGIGRGGGTARLADLTPEQLAKALAKQEG